MLDSPDGKQGSLCCLPGGGVLQLLTKVGQVAALQHAKRDLKHLLQTLLPATLATLFKNHCREKKCCLGQNTVYQKTTV